MPSTLLQRAFIAVLAALLFSTGCALEHHASTDASADHRPMDVGADSLDHSDGAFDRTDAHDATDVTDGSDANDVLPDTLQCDGGVICSGVCVNAQTNQHNCGACGNDCAMLPFVAGTSARCVAGVCDLTASCVAGHADCDGDPSNGCETDITVGAHCGSCTTVCLASAPMCALNSGSYVCTTGCLPPTPDHCATSCTSIVTDVNNCGSCGNACPMGPHSLANCTARTCGLSCDPNFADCDGVATNGCEVDVAGDPLHCGGCSFACPVGANATATCTGTVCGLACAAGFGDCDGLSGNGCEAVLTNDPSHCGTCGTSCPVPANSARTCMAGTCGFMCSAGFADCDGVAANGCETNLTNTLTHCGSCANACGTPANSAPTCVASTCGFVCTTGHADCDGNASNGCEATLATDIAHCGACATVCATPPNATPTCAAFTCGFACTAGTGNCDGNGANGCESTFATDPLHCGSCANTCPTPPNATPTCAASACGFACSAGFGNCDGMGGNGCEVDFTRDPTHCGSCGSPCPVPLNATATCTASVCGFNCNTGFVLSGGRCVPMPGDVCPGAAVTLADGDTQVLIGSTTGFGATSTGSCAGGPSGSDVSYTITPAASGTLRLTLGAFFDAFFYVRGTCSSAELACTSALDAGHSDGTGSATIAVTAGTPVSVWVDGRGAAAGQYALELQLNVACGNHRLDSGEQCDDGNRASGDGCHADCSNETPTTDACGPGLSGLPIGNGPTWFTGTTTGAANDLTSSCVTGGGGSPDVIYTIVPTVSGTMRATVFPTAHWDPQIYVRGACASADLACQNANPGDFAESATFTVVAGTRYLVVIDGTGGGGGGSGPFQIEFEVAQCGDGVLQTGETCDDANTTPGDGCDAMCQNEARCSFAEMEPNPSTTPNAVSIACPRFDVNAAITPTADEDFFTVNLLAGQVIDARTFVGSPLAPSRADTVLEIYRGPIAAPPTNTQCNNASAALMCSDDTIMTSDLVSAGSFPVPVSGAYVVRVIDFGNGAAIPSYGLQLHTH